jgi:hypothetical protein
MHCERRACLLIFIWNVCVGSVDVNMICLYTAKGVCVYILYNRCPDKLRFKGAQLMSFSPGSCMFIGKHVKIYS